MCHKSQDLLESYISLLFIYNLSDYLLTFHHRFVLFLLLLAVEVALVVVCTHWDGHEWDQVNRSQSEASLCKGIEHESAEVVDRRR